MFIMELYNVNRGNGKHLRRIRNNSLNKGGTIKGKHFRKNQASFKTWSAELSVFTSVHNLFSPTLCV